MRILIVKSSSMGDVVHALPAAWDIAEHFPDARIDWVAEESFRDIPELSPFVSEVVVTAFRRWQKAPFAAQTRAEVKQLKKRLRAGDYDLVIDMQGLVRTGLVAHWTKARRAAGFSFDTIREWPAALAYSRGNRFRLVETMGAVNRYRVLAAAALGYQAKGRPRFGLRAVKENPLKNLGSYAVLAVNTSQDRKLWPEKNWVEVARKLRELDMKAVLFWGNGTEKERVERIASAVPDAVVPDRMPLSLIASVLSDARLVIGVDTGITHLGAAMGRPTAGIFVQTSLEKVPVVGDGRYVNLGGPGEMPSASEVLQRALEQM